MSGADIGRPELEDKPPLLGSWKAIYMVVIGNLFFFVGLFYLLTRLYE